MKALAFSTWHFALSGNANSLSAALSRATTSSGVRFCFAAVEASARVMGKRNCMLTSGPDTSTASVPLRYCAAAVPSRRRAGLGKRCEEGEATGRRG